jgi:hypothetical protein
MRSNLLAFSDELAGTFTTGTYPYNRNAATTAAEFSIAFNNLATSTTKMLLATGDRTVWLVDVLGTTSNGLKRIGAPSSGIPVASSAGGVGLYLAYLVVAF